MTSQHAVGAASADAARHPLDPLNADEIGQAVSILAGDGRVSSALRFVSVGLREPSKGEVASFRPGQAFAREACIVALDPREHMTYEAVVSITAQSVLSWRPVPVTTRTPSRSTGCTQSWILTICPWSGWKISGWCRFPRAPGTTRTAAAPAVVKH